jgi:hypothetical protein
LRQLGSRDLTNADRGLVDPGNERSQGVSPRRSGRRRAVVGAPRHTRWAPANSRLRPARLPGGSPVDRERPLRTAPRLLRRRGDGQRGGVSTVRALPTRSVPLMEGNAAGRSVAPHDRGPQGNAPSR